MNTWIGHYGFPIVGLTGSISSGKTFVASIARSFGFEHINTDDIAKNILRQDREIQEHAQTITGIQPVRLDGSIDKAFGKTLFSNPTMLKEYEALIHPLVFKNIQIFFDTLVPPYPKGLLIESAIWRQLEEIPTFDSIWVVEAPEHKRVERFLVKNPDGLGLFKEINLNQLKSSPKIDSPMYTIINDGRDLHQVIEGICNETIKEWAKLKNLRA